MGSENTFDAAAARALVRAELFPDERELAVMEDNAGRLWALRHGADNTDAYESCRCLHCVALENIVWLVAVIRKVTGARS